jgi:hypothetical protein
MVNIRICEVSVTLVADDLLLTANNIKHVKNLLNITESYLANLSMKLPPRKCMAFHIISTKDSWYMSEATLTLKSGECIPTAHAARKIKYLGAEIWPWKGLDSGNIEDEFHTILTNIK